MTASTFPLDLDITRIATVRIAIVGDVHDQWEAADAEALYGLGVDLVLFVGDFGNEAVGVVRQVAQLQLPKAVMLGNHDAWFSASHWGKQHCPYDRTREDWVQLQIDLLGDDFVGFGKKDFPDLGLSVVGGRPFSWGGDVWKNRSFYQTRFGVTDFETSIDRTMQALKMTTCDNLVLLGHNGPVGLGALQESICGKDWGDAGGDYGDPDLAAVLAQAPQVGKQVSLVAFGHMHHSLRHRRDRLRETTAWAGNALCVNAACVPRIRDGLRNFTIVTLQHDLPTQVALVWVNGQGEVKSEQIAYSNSI
jgi:uncharacterized protein (TIGR04168 family)